MRQRAIAPVRHNFLSVFFFNFLRAREEFKYNSDSYIPHLSMRITVNTVDKGSGSVLLNTSNYRLNVRDCQDSVRLHRHGAHLPLSWRGACAVVANLRTSLTGISTVSFCISAYPHSGRSMAVTVTHARAVCHTPVMFGLPLFL